MQINTIYFNWSSEISRLLPYIVMIARVFTHTSE